ncbi:hypothetical protein P170DRAFT_356191 [Aspergillus steynii IBT 23096]|uniref:Zn(2)-C6 fungal-type domain-containing protein n=1 Tax=Aspergillus steynii IBT 23096 TaxID=1392250 RepID=A0A2I2GEU3_9EURO|nr:uncharacterized protein P170DRAFT_356191 [Aspergillus steynii IBT 23096]PLB51347.1 hypothetical protein P170DRAFT_356191 [Aspergillus steynii IBT 23096]
MKTPGVEGGSVRRNGKPTSCEPCRLSKIRCDHARPTCNRCVQRKLTAKCFYHPAPLTRPRGSAKSRRQTQSTPSTARTEQSLDRQLPISPAACPQLQTPGGSSGIVESEPSTTGRVNYLGPSSFLSVFHDVSPNLEVSTFARSSVLWGRWTSASPSITRRLVQLLRPLATYEELLIQKYDECRFTVIPEPLVLRPLRLLRAQVEDRRWFDDEEALASMITRNTAEKSIDITPNMTADEFYATFTGDNLRWEFVGLIFTLAGLAATTAWNQHQTFLEDRDRDAFAEEMAAASNACIEICNQYDNVNDLVVWLYYTHFSLAADAMEDLSHYVYRLYGELISHMHALGLHRLQISNAEIPFFLSETRKRLFTACYRTDKNMAMFLGRPPRLQDHFCDTDMPLDLDDGSLVLDPEALKQVLAGLSPDGWGDVPIEKGNIRPATAVRVRYMIAKLRERVVVFFVGKKTKTFDEDVQAVYLDLKHLWDTIPVQFHYHTTGFGDKNPATAAIRVITCLEYLHTISQIERIRCRDSPDAMHNLLDSSMRIVTALIDFIKARKQGGNIQKEYTGVFLLYGLPAAGVLAIELHRCTVSETPLPSCIPRSKIIRNLGLLVSWFEDANSSMSVTQKNCVQVSEVITRLLDETLNHQPGAGLQTTGQFQHRLGPDTSERPMIDGVTAVASDTGSLVLPDENCANVNTFGTSVEFLDWWDEFWVDGAIPEAVL